MLTVAFEPHDFCLALLASEYPQLYNKKSKAGRMRIMKPTCAMRVTELSALGDPCAKQLQGARSALATYSSSSQWRLTGEIAVMPTTEGSSSSDHTPGPSPRTF